MSKSAMYALFDSRNDSFMPPFTASHQGEAIRGVVLGLRSGKPLFAQFPKEFSLYQVGSFESSSGELIALVPPKHIANVQALAEQDKENGNAQAS